MEVGEHFNYLFWSLVTFGWALLFPTSSRYEFKYNNICLGSTSRL